MRRFNVFNMIGVCFLIAAIYLGYCAVRDYALDVERQDWSQTTAVVTDISSREIRHSRGKRGSRYETVYDIVYAYQVDGLDYSGQISGTRNFRVHGEELRIKYDPAFPADSTVTLAPSLYDLIVPLIAAAVFGIFGFFVSGMWTLFRGKQKHREPEPPETYMEEPVVMPDAVPKTMGGILLHFVKALLILAVFIAVLVGFVKLCLSLGPGKDAVSTERVHQILAERGYEAVDATQEYRESWQIELDSVLAMEAEELSFLFIDTPDVGCAKDVVDALYSYSLATVSKDADVEYKYTGNRFVICVMEGEGQYSFQIRVEDTVAYAQCSQNMAAEVVAILDEIAYFN